MRPIRLEREKEALDCNYTTEQNPTSPNNKIDIISCKLKLVVQWEIQIKPQSVDGDYRAEIIFLIFLISVPH